MEFIIIALVLAGGYYLYTKHNAKKDDKPSEKPKSTQGTSGGGRKPNKNQVKN